MSGARKRRGTTLVELSLVIAILAMVALPFAAFVSQNLKNTVQSSTQLKEQMVLEQVMQDMEKHLRSAIRVKSDGTSCPITFPTGGISFTSSDPQKVVSTRSVQTQYTYVLASGLLTRTVGMNSGVTFPDGLEASLITKLKFWSTTTEPPDAATPEPPDAATPPCYLTVRMEAYNPTLQTTTALQETIYLRNYTLIVDIAKILGVTAPVPGATPTSAIPATSEYTATISWSGSPVTFAAGTPYTATITLTPRGDYTLTGVAANFFTVDGAASVTNPAGSGTTTAIVVTATFPAIGATQLSITAPALTLSKPYDGNTTAAVTAGTLIGVVSPDVVTVTAVATYDTAAAGAGKTITVVYTLAGADAGKYAKPANDMATTGVITTKQLTITGTALTTSKPYDGNTTAAVTAGTLIGVVSPDVVTVTAVATYDTAAAGAGKTITIVYTLGGADATRYAKPADYTVTTGVIIATQLAITPPTLTLSKPYDGTTTATVTAGALSGVVGGDTVTVTAVATYDTAAVGAGKTITVVYSLAGADAAKYVKPVDYTVTTGVITTKQLMITVPALTTSKPYDGNTTAAVTAGVLVGVVSPDVVTVSAVATYDTAAVGAGKTITIVYTLGGADAARYVKPIDYTVTGTITAKPLTVTATGPSKAYGTALTAGTSATNFTAGATGVGSEVVTSVTLTPNAAGLSATTAAGAAYVVTPSLATGSGGFLASNYLVTYTAYNGTVAAAPITAIGAITGTPQVGQTLTAGTVTPSGATTTYRWQSATTSGGTYADITGATGTTYTLVAGDLAKYIKVVATGTGNYTGTVTSAATGVITLAPIDIAAILGVTPPLKGATPVTTITATAQYTGTVTWQPNPGNQFTPNKVYTATITLTPTAGYTLTGVAANLFTVAGATTVTNPVNSGVVTAVFPATAP